MADDRDKRIDARAALKAAMLDLIFNDDDIKSALVGVITNATGLADTKLDEPRIMTLIEERLLRVAPRDVPSLPDVEKVVLDILRAYLRPEAVNGNVATALFKR